VIANQIGDLGREIIADDLLKPVRDLVAKASSLEEIRDSMYDLYPDMDGARFGELLRSAVLMAEMVGRGTVVDEAT